MATQRKLGTFLGVYTPTILTILGTILYLRSGWLTGHLGIQAFLIIILLSNVITLITALSISSAATNIKVGAGGAGSWLQPEPSAVRAVSKVSATTVFRCIARIPLRFVSRGAAA